MEKIDELLEFWNDGSNKDIFNRDKEDFEISKNFASGNGFSSVSSNLWPEQRARVYADFINSNVSQIVSMFELAPPEINNFEIDRKIMSDALREILNDGKSFMLVYNQGNTLKVKRLSNLQTYISEDFKKALHLSKITKKKAEAKGVKFGGTDQILIDSFKNTLKLGSNEAYLLTYYEKTEGGVEISEFIGNEQAGETVKLNLRHLPIVAFFGDPQFVDNKPNFRGLYYKARGILITISFVLSFIQEKIACAPNVQFLVPEETLGDNAQQWTSMNGEPQAMLTYKSRDTLDGNAVVYPPPQRVDQSLQIQEALQLLDKLIEILQIIMGGDMAGEARSHETAESVLLRREKKDASGNAYIRSMLSGLDVLAKVLTDYYAVLGENRHCEVVDRYFAKMKQSRDFQTLLNLMQIAKDSPAFAAALAEKTDLDDATKQQAQAAVNVQGLLSNVQAIQEQANQSAIQMQAMQKQIDQLTAANISLENSKQEQVYAAQVRAQTDIQRTLIQNETELIKLQMADGKNNIDVAMRFEELRQNSIDQLIKLNRDLVKYN